MAPPQSPPQGLLERARLELRARHYSPRTERAYVGWIRRFVHFHDRRHPRELGAAEVRAFLDDLVAAKVSASTHHQALCAIVFLYDEVLGLTPPWVADLARPRRATRLPTVLTREEARLVLTELHGTTKLMAGLLYGSGLRLLECARLRVQDLDFSGSQVVVRNGKGRKDRVTLFPEQLRQPLREHL
ncbi:MAG: phage integrase N-terminal SAM-like domain-containing protein, partial [Deltaproteobacteria bacterium]|nr:phage integrase N-terminal SAM-like domain-containing protein [Deltaproteobacteria bacterium]